MRTISFLTWGKRGFTLVELVVSISILSILLLGLSSMMLFVAKTWLSGINSTDNFTKARVVLNLLDRDIQMMVLRQDLAAFVDSSTPGNSACSFYTNVQGNPGTGLTGGSPDSRTVSLVQYLLNNPTSQPTLQRLNYGMNFLNAFGARPTIGNPLNLPAPSNANLQTDTIFTGVIRFQWQFIDGSGAILNPPYTLSSTPPATSSPPTSNTPFWFDYAVPNAPYNPRVVVLSMVVLSNSAYKIALQNSNAMTSLLADFSATPPTNQTYSQVWTSVLNPSSGSFDPSLPAPIRDSGAVQVFERHIPLPIVSTN
jgi:prepilin-type N-terminal cleavage/methylation domain-containing protein